mgnify:FL=1
MKHICYKEIRYPIRVLVLSYLHYDEFIVIISINELKDAFGYSYVDWDDKAKSLFGRIHYFLPKEHFNAHAKEISEKYLDAEYKFIKER